MHEPRIDPYSRAARRRRIAGAAALAVTGIVFWAALLASGAFLPPPTFQATLTQTGTGIDETPAYSGMLFANLSLQFARPGAIDPANFVITVTSPSGPLYTWNGTSYSTATLPYLADWSPHWLAVFPGEVRWGGFSAWITNPNGVEVGYTSQSGPWGEQGSASLIDTGATITLSFPTTVSSPAGFVVEVTERGTPGSASLTLS